MTLNWKLEVSIGYTKPNIITTQFNEIKLSDSISPGQMAESQKRDTTQLSLGV